MYFRMGLTRMANSRVYSEKDTRYAQAADIGRKKFLKNILPYLYFVDNQIATEKLTQCSKLCKSSRG